MSKEQIHSSVQSQEMNHSKQFYEEDEIDHCNGIVISEDKRQEGM